ncbi:MAG: hypothetical protein JNL01_13530 [Bdellovibrionales bacterium]|nr:hypothetical protein [Bdellovibrionales bacterium]
MPLKKFVRNSVNLLVALITAGVGVGFTAFPGAIYGTGSVPDPVTDWEIIRLKTPNFIPDVQALLQKKIQTFFELQMDDGKPFSDDDRFNGSKGQTIALKKFLDFDLNGTWAKRGSDEYYVGMGKSAYVVEKDISYFTLKQACSLKFIKMLAPTLDISEVSTCRFLLKPDGLAPGVEFTVQRFDNHSKKPADQKFLSLDPSLGMPDKTEIQYNEKFTRVLGIRTVKDGAVIKNYYAQPDGRTLVIAYSLSFIHNVPPGFAGGPDRLRKELDLQLPPTIDRLNAAVE